MAARAICTQLGLFCSRGRAGAVLSGRLQPAFGCSRPMATEAALPPHGSAADPAAIVRTIPAPSPEPIPFAIRRAPTVLATSHSFPTMEPVRFEQFPSSFLFAPLRRDILHKAVVFEGDAHRLGRGSAKTRAEVHGSGRKIRPQKGTGCARLGNRKSPMLRGGGAAHGPKPRDFSSDLPRKMYAMAWRTALSYRYRRSELVLVAGPLELMAADHSLALAILATHRWGNDGHRSLFVAAQHRPNLAEAMEPLGAEGRLLTVDEVDVKDLLETGRVVIEVEALRMLEAKHGLPESPK